MLFFVVSLKHHQLTVSLDLSIPEYVLVTQQVQSISALVFISSVVALGGGALTGFSAIAFVWLAVRSTSKAINRKIELTETTKRSNSTVTVLS